MGERPVTQRSVAAENQEIIAAGSYRAPNGATVSVAAQVEAACQGTVSYTPQRTAQLLTAWRTERAAALDSGLLSAGTGHWCGTVVEVTPESSMAAARRLAGDGTSPDTGGTGAVAVLNFASARNPGGGYLGGARAQEEDLCRVSALYKTLLCAPDYYSAHRAAASDAFYSHRVICSPDVPVFRGEDYALLERPYAVSFLTSPAPNASAIARDRRAEIPGVLTQRAARVLAVAARHERRRLVLGAWGCGVFRNDPAMVAQAFHGLLASGGLFAGAFEHVVFAVLDRGAGRRNLEAFRTELTSA